MGTAKDDIPIKISLIGETAYKEDKDTVIVGSDSDYVQACHAIRDCAIEHGRLKISVRKKLHYTWLQSYMEQTGIPYKCIEKTPRKILEERWGVSVPEWVTDEMIISQDLLNLDVEVLPSISFEVILLNYFFGKAFLPESLNEENLPDIVMVLTGSNAQGQLKKLPILSRCLEERCKTWSENSKVEWAKGLCGVIVNDVEGLWRDLTLWSLLCSYPEKLLEFVMPPDHIALIRNVPSEVVKRIPLNSVALEQATTQVEMFFKEIQQSVKSGAELSKLIAATSGRLPKEFWFLKGMLASGQIEVSEKEINLIRQKFQGCPGVSPANLAGLQRFVPVQRPTIPSLPVDWEVERWIRWCIDEYMPYRKWQILNGKFDDQVEGVIQSFTDWYFNRYVEVHKDSRRSLVHLLQQWSSYMKDDEFSVVLLVDSLPLFFWNILESALIRSGFHKHESSDRFVPLPSTTETCKPLLLTGDWTETEKDYGKMLTKRANEEYPEKAPFYHSSLKALSEFEPSDKPSIVLLNFLAMDELLHSDVEAGASSYDEELYALFSRVADTVRTLFEKWTGNSDHFSIYVITDHGATRILEEEKKTLDSKVMNKLFPDEKHRFSKVKKTDVASVPENLWSLGYQFTSPFGDEEVVYFIPKGHNTVRMAGVRTGFVHGGASPEEVIVRGAVFRAVKAGLKRPGLRFLDLTRVSGKAVFYVQRVIQLKVEVQNSNIDPITVTHIDIASPAADVKEFTTPTIQGEGYGILQVDCYFNKSAQERDELIINVAYEADGEEYNMELKQTATFKTATTAGFSLKDLK